MRRRRILLSIGVGLLVLTGALWLARWQFASWLARMRREEMLTREQVESDLALLEERLLTRYSYLRRTGYDCEAALAGIRSRAQSGMMVGDFAVELVRFLAPFGDGHSRLRTKAAYFPPGFAPFRVREGLVATVPRGDRLLAEGHPHLAAIDGVPVARWLEAAKAFVAQGTEAFVRRGALEMLVHTALLRRELGLPARRDVTVTLDPGAKQVTFDLGDDFTDTMIWSGRPHRDREPRLLDGEIGYLPIPDMDENLIPSIREAMTRFRATNGLVIDVRGNGGGSRDILFALFPYFLTPGDAPRVFNIAALRLVEGQVPDLPTGHLGDRFLFPAGHPGWGARERAAIAEAAARFKPEWTLPEGQFSAWHYGVLSPPVADDPSTFHYARPVVVLMDGDCFSATDIFLSAFKGHRSVTLMGSPSGGGSGRALPLKLPASRLQLQLSSMASFRPDGTLHEGRGVEPDVLAEPTVDDLLGRTDTLLNRAIAHLRR